MIKRIITGLLTLIILFAIIKLIDIPSFLAALAHPKWLDLTAAFLLFFPLFFITAYRWQILVRKSCQAPFWESIKLILASGTLNLILPSKLGDLSKGLFLRNTGKVDLARGMNIVIFEKLIDLCSLGIVYLIGFLVHEKSLDPIVRRSDLVCVVFVLIVIATTLLIYFFPLRRIPGYSGFIQWLESGKMLSKIGYFLEDGQKLLALVRQNNRQIMLILVLSFVLWFVHMTQVFFFIRAVDVTPSIIAVYHLAPMAIFVGLIPVTISGIGIRDGSFMFLFSSYGSQAVLFAASCLITTRYLVPGLLGIPFVHEYLVRQKVEG